MNISLTHFLSMKTEILEGFRNLLINQNGKIDYKTYKINLKDYINNILKILIIVNLVSYTFYGNIFYFVIFIPFILIYPFLLRDNLAKKRRDKLLVEFKDSINILMSFLDAGFSCENAFIQTRNEIKKLYKNGSYIESELDYICKFISINKPIEIPIRDFSYRSGIDDIIDFADCFILAKKSGGHLHKIIGNTIKIIRDKIQIYIDINTKTTEKKFEQNIMNLIPFFIIIYLNLTSKGFLLPMYNTFIGKIIMTVLLIIYIFSYLLSVKILNIEV